MPPSAVEIGRARANKILFGRRLGKNATTVLKDRFTSDSDSGLLVPESYEALSEVRAGLGQSRGARYLRRGGTKVEEAVLEVAGPKGTIQYLPAQESYGTDYLRPTIIAVAGGAVVDPATGNLSVPPGGSFTFRVGNDTSYGDRVVLVRDVKIIVLAFNDGAGAVINTPQADHSNLLQLTQDVDNSEAAQTIWPPTASAGTLANASARTMIGQSPIIVDEDPHEEKKACRLWCVASQFTGRTVTVLNPALIGGATANPSTLFAQVAMEI